MSAKTMKNITEVHRAEILAFFSSEFIFCCTLFSLFHGNLDNDLEFLDFAVPDRAALFDYVKEVDFLAGVDDFLDGLADRLGVTIR